MSLKKLGRYDLIRVLGKGAMGQVYEGRDPNLDRRVAIKTIKVENLSEDAAAEYEVRFRTEARSAARLQHPNIVSVYDSGRDGDIAFLVMEFIQGDDLKHLLDKGECYTLAQTLGIMGDLLSALDYAHRQNLVHRDIKPANLLIETSGRVKLTDFGVARIQDSGEATWTRDAMVGTLKYMSPEQVQGRPIDARADLFAAGIVLYQLLTGKRPFDGDNDFAIIQQIVGHTPAAPTSCNPKLPPAIDAVVARALGKSRDQRFATAQEFAAMLQAASREASDPTIVPPASPPGPGSHSTWTASPRADESLVGTQPGTSAGVFTVTQELELVYWKDIKDSTDVEDILGFLGKFPSGIYADLARRRLRKLGVLLGEDSDTGMSPDNADRAWKALEEAAAQTPVPSAAQAVSAASPSNDPRATRLGASDRTAALAEDKAHDQRENPSTGQDNGQAGQAGPEAPVAAQAPGARPGPVTSPRQALPLLQAAKASAPAPTSRHWAWALAGIVALAGAGLGFKLLSGSGAPRAAPGDPGAALAATTTTTAASAPLPVVDAATTQAAAPAASAPVAAGPVALKITAAMAAATAKKPANNKDRVSRQTQAKAATSAVMLAPVMLEPAPVEHAAPAPVEHAAPAAASVAATNPQQACEDRMLIGFQICMAEQCGKPAFTHHPVCVERRAMEQRRSEANQLRR
ncbi:MAG: serine/threonine-protein kinase [Polaromonas sp.]